MTTIDHRGHDLVIIPNEEMLHLPTPELLQTLFGAHLPSDVRTSMGRDKRHAFLRTQPLHFQAVKRALLAQRTLFSVVFEERPELPLRLRCRSSHAPIKTKLWQAGWPKAAQV